MGGRAADWLLAAGSQFTFVDVDSSLLLRKRYHLRVKQCFYNCQWLALNLKTPSGLIYWEGTAIPVTGVPVSHAWLTNGEGSRIVLDPTWVRKRDPLFGCDYFGVAIPNWFVEERKEAKKYWDSVLHAWIDLALKEGK